MLAMLLDHPPDTVRYLIAGYVVLLGFPLLYVLSWLVRRRSLEKDIEFIQSLEDEPE